MIDGPPTPPLVLRRTNRAIVILVPLVLVGWMVVRTGSLAAAPGSLVFAAGVTSGLLCAEWLCLRMLRRVPALPFFERASYGQRPWVAMGIAAILIMAAREHVCGLSGVEYELWEAQTRAHHEVGTSARSESVDGEPPDFAGHPVSCVVTCTLGHGDLCDAAVARIRCDPEGAPDAVHVDVSIRPTSPGCSLVPFFHRATVAYEASGSIDARNDHGFRSLSFTIDGEVSRDATGFHSCAALDAAIGAQIGEDVFEALDDMLDDEGG